MPSFFSTLRNGCVNLFKSFKSTLSTFKNWFHREVSWALEDIVSTIHRIYHNHLRPFVLRMLRFIYKHHLAIAIGALSIVVIVYPSIITLPLLLILGILGFAAMGPAAGSLAASYQAMIGSVTPGSLFATFQSAGMFGYGLGALNGFVIASGALVLLAVLVCLIMAWRAETEKEKERMM